MSFISDVSGRSSFDLENEDSGFIEAYDTVGPKEAEITALQELVDDKIRKKAALGQVIFQQFPFKDREGNLLQDDKSSVCVLETGLLVPGGHPDECIDRVAELSEEFLVLIPLILTTKSVGQEDEQGDYDHLKNHIVGVVVDKANKQIEYYDPQGKTQEKESRRLLLHTHVSARDWVHQLYSKLREPENVVVQIGDDDDWMNLGNWQIISNNVRHQGYFDHKTCGYRVTRFFHERIKGGAGPEMLFFAKDSPLVGRGYTHRAYVQTELETEIARLRSEDSSNSDSSIASSSE